MLEKELLEALKIVKVASKLTSKIQSEITSNEILTKKDASPVTISDLASQYLILNHLNSQFPNDAFIAEEDTSEETIKFLEDVLNLVNQYSEKDTTIEHLAEIINLGASKGAVNGINKRHWVLDPIDGTKGFIRGDQFAICLSLLNEKGQVILGVLGCPNLSLNKYYDSELHGKHRFNYAQLDSECGTDGYIFYSKAEEDFVSFASDNKIDLSKLITLEGFEKTHSSHDLQDLIKQKFNINNALHLDSQVKYCLLALNLGNLYLRLPTSLEFREKIWDHAAGNSLLKSLNYNHTDSLDDLDVDFYTGGRFFLTKGVIASNLSKELHAQVVAYSKDLILKKFEGKK
ncbi:3(2),5-bisphosphate nucleotidase HAL2 [Hanseniaspora valbyensis NRRL Y-1626]|uniref:3'(2'),5'-bisphosphate nucleotidase n=1 Tax=Hanseniaspora valbyensis NRRL Y-1626 TaxID=766949 RepID=A0A1B7TET7_9ASCO|nr:3(2),5-bisphosphate nucleotidase HAL2 [Hanseniaspora valbyensis NRRL Y-1626]